MQQEDNKKIFALIEEKLEDSNFNLN